MAPRLPADLVRSRLRRALGLSVALLAGLLPGLAHAEPARGPAHDGLLLRLTLGFGGASTQNDQEPDLVLSGVAGFFSFDIGGTLATGTALHARLSAHSMVEPNVEVDGRDLGELTDSSLSFALLGVGVTHYFPSNLYLTGVLGLAQATAEIDGLEIESETGFGLAGDIGYEWPVGGDWGLGIAGRLEFYSIPDDADRLEATALGVLFSATYH